MPTTRTTGTRRTRRKPARTLARQRPLRFQIQQCHSTFKETLLLDNGRTVLMRPIEPEDARALRAGFSLLSAEDVRFRFLHPMNELTEDYARQLARVDPPQGFALVMAEPMPAGEALVGAVARLAMDLDTHATEALSTRRAASNRRAEFALVVGTPLKGYGLGRYLLEQLIEWCRVNRVNELYGEVHTDNAIMLHLCESLGFTRHHVSGEPGLERVEKRITRK